MKEIILTRPATLSSLTTSRKGESKIGDVISCGDCGASYPDLDLLANYLRHSGTKFVLLGIPEDIGVRANGGRAGAHGAWSAFLTSFLNLQANQFLNLKDLHVLGEIPVEDLMIQSIKSSVEELRTLCAEIDTRVAKAIASITAVGLVPILIGGGHNNAFGIHAGIGKPLSVINIDPHLDFRPLEGRHSGNAFSYSHNAALLSKYFVIGMHEQSNAQEMIERFLHSGFLFSTYEEIAVRRSTTLTDAVHRALQHIGTTPAGIEIDLDAIAAMPSSAESAIGFNVQEVLFCLDSIASKMKTSYLHLSEGAPSLGGDQGARSVGKTLSSLVTTFLKASKGV